MLRILTLASVALLFQGCATFAPSYPSVYEPSEFSSFSLERSEQTNSLAFGNVNAKTAFVYYPGGKVEPEAYSGFAHALASQANALVLIIPMPLDLAVFGANKAEAVTNKFPNIERWILIGHSLGGTMAATHLFANQDTYEGLVLLASYPQRKHNFSDSELAFISIIGSNDGLIPLNEWQTYRDQFPEQTRFHVIDGANHAGFGDYGKQDGDLLARLSNAEQQDIAIQHILSWLKLNF